MPFELPTTCSNRLTICEVSFDYCFVTVFYFGRASRCDDRCRPITLGVLIPFPAGDPRAAIVLGYAPNPGLARRIPRSEILSKLALAGKSADDLQLPDS